MGKTDGDPMNEDVNREALAQAVQQQVEQMQVAEIQREIDIEELKFKHFDQDLRHSANMRHTHSEAGEQGKYGGIDGIPDTTGDNDEGVDIVSAGVERLIIDVQHLGAHTEKTETSLANSTKYWIEVDLTEPNTGSVANAVTLQNGIAWPTSPDLLVWKLGETNADSSRMKLWRAAWLETDGTYMFLRFSNISAPDVPLGTVRMSTSDYVPLGWSVIDEMAGRVAVGQGPPDTDYDTVGNEGGHEFADLDHVHFGGPYQFKEINGEDAYEDDESGRTACIRIMDLESTVEDWSGDDIEEDTTKPDADHILDLRQPWRVFRFIKRTAIT